MQPKKLMIYASIDKRTLLQNSNNAGKTDESFYNYSFKFKLKHP